MIDLLFWLFFILFWMALGWAVRPYYDWYRQHKECKRHEEEGL